MAVPGAGEVGPGQVETVEVLIAEPAVAQVGPGVRFEQSGDCPATKWAGAETRPVPTALTACTRARYPCPSVSPVSAGGGTSVEQVPFGAFTVYPVIGEPPSDVGAVHEMVPPPSMGTATTSFG